MLVAVEDAEGATALVLFHGDASRIDESNFFAQALGARAEPLCGLRARGFVRHDATGLEIGSLRFRRDRGRGRGQRGFGGVTIFTGAGVGKRVRRCSALLSSTPPPTNSAATTAPAAIEPRYRTSSRRAPRARPAPRVDGAAADRTEAERIAHALLELGGGALELQCVEQPALELAAITFQEPFHVVPRV